jgi:hypothetical protein
MYINTYFGKHVESLRLALGLTPGQLATTAGITNTSTGGDRIRQFELRGVVTDWLLEKLTRALNIDTDTITKLHEANERAVKQAWLEWVEQPIKPYATVRYMCSVGGLLFIPEECTTRDEAMNWLRNHKFKQLQRCLVWSRRESIIFEPDGREIVIHASVNEIPNPLKAGIYFQM